MSVAATIRQRYRGFRGSMCSRTRRPLSVPRRPGTDVGFVAIASRRSLFDLTLGPVDTTPSGSRGDSTPAPTSRIGPIDTSEVSPPHRRRGLRLLQPARPPARSLSSAPALQARRRGRRPAPTQAPRPAPRDRLSPRPLAAPRDRPRRTRPRRAAYHEPLPAQQNRRGGDRGGKRRVRVVDAAAEEAAA